ncbi:MAG TPA: hypothetical protein VGV68_02605, partial [Terriglobia bacterium]|nr:hypothetical protein [Terriglobia bacterium]
RTSWSSGDDPIVAACVMRTSGRRLDRSAAGPSIDLEIVQELKRAWLGDWFAQRLPSLELVRLL